MKSNLLKLVRDYWEQSSCGERLYLKERSAEGYREQAEIRYDLEPYIADFASFEGCEGKRILEIGTGLGADHERFAGFGGTLHGIDLSDRAIRHTDDRFKAAHLCSHLCLANAEDLPYADATFDVVYSWGVLHHVPDTQKAVNEIFRVLKRGGEVRVMIYHRYSIVGLMLWLRYGLPKLKFNLKEIYAEHLESPGTKAFSFSETRSLFRDFRNIQIKSVLTHGDLLLSRAGQRHCRGVIDVIRKLWPRFLIKRLFFNKGLYLLITACK